MTLNLYSTSANPNPKTILRIEEVLNQTGLKRTMLYDLIRKERFPKQVSLGARAVGWYQDRVEKWIKNRPATRSNHAWREPDLIAKTHPTLLVSKQLPGDLKTACSCAQAHQKDAQLVESCSAEVANPAGGNRNRIAAHSESAFTRVEELMHLRDENAQLKRLIAELVLKNDLLQSATEH